MRSLRHTDDAVSRCTSIGKRGECRRAIRGPEAKNDKQSIAPVAVDTLFQSVPENQRSRFTNENHRSGCPGLTIFTHNVDAGSYKYKCAGAMYVREPRFIGSNPAHRAHRYEAPFSYVEGLEWCA